MEIVTKTFDKGIYAITCSVNGKKYIGSSSRSLKKRFEQHINLLKKGSHHSKYLQNAFIKYGEAAFKFEILESYEDEEPEFILEREQYYLNEEKAYNPKYGFNECSNARNSSGRKLSKETREKISKSALGHKRCVGRVTSEETKKKISLANKGKSTRLGKFHSEESKKKMSESRMGNKNSLGRKLSVEVRLGMANRRTPIPITIDLVKTVMSLEPLSVTQISKRLGITRAQVYAIRNKWSKELAVS